MTPDEINTLFRKIVSEENKNLPSYKHISKISVRTEDFKRTNSMKIARK